jgi:NAD(P)-dependent dehydrogenase (short-subunit alcohol dehydrogenase family)
MTRVAAVTGGAGAIGGGIVAGLRAAGHEVAIFDLNGTAVVDLASRAAVQAGAAAVLDRYGRCDVLVHAAAAFDRASLLDLDPEVWHRVQAVNVESALWLAQAVVPGMAGGSCSSSRTRCGTRRLVTCSRTWPARPP